MEVTLWSRVSFDILNKVASAVSHRGMWDKARVFLPQDIRAVRDRRGRNLLEYDLVLPAG